MRPGCDLRASASIKAYAQTVHAVPDFPTRIDIVKWIAALGFDGSGVELGVKQGEFAEQTLAAWPRVRAYYLVDPWLHQAVYVDVANVDDAQHSAFMRETLQRVSRFGERVHVVRNFSYDAVRQFDDCTLDYVFVDAVHDYEGALRDLVDWWPKIRAGGVLAGHDYIDGWTRYGLFG